jgi:N-acetylmuramoyl-L-alanine amidase
MFNFKRWFIMARKIDKIILHCAATPEGRDVKTETIKSWHVKGNGWSDIGYHFVIELDGAVKNGRPLHRSGAHTKGHNATSIGICYVGGMDKDKKPKDTRTEAQRKAMDQLIADLKMDHPTATIHGHNEFAAKACPSFDVSKEYGAPKPKVKAKAKAESKKSK